MLCAERLLKMKIRVEDVQLGEFKDTADFKKLKQECYTAASKGTPIDFSELPPAEYKYFSEMYWIYSDFAEKRIAENVAKEREQKAYKEYCENKNDQTTYLQNIAYWQANIKAASDSLSMLCKTADKDKALELAVGIVEKLLNDSTIMKTVQKNVTA
jgi:hypothetical protein